jgi:vacuolar-type H+-ATPase subunit E/Vma4
MIKKGKRETLEATKGALDTAAKEAEQSDLRERVQAAVDASWRYGMTLQELIDAVRKRLGNGHGELSN